jgi:hypothetical protein
MDIQDNESNNKRWLHILNLVTTLSEWTEVNIAPTHVVWDSQGPQGRDKNEPDKGHSRKPHSM